MYAEAVTLIRENSKAVEWIDSKTVRIHGEIDGSRIPSRILEELIQESVRKGARRIYVKACGQHGIGGRIWPRNEKVEVIVEGPVGQRLGAMGMFGTEIIVKGPASNDVGWLNCGASITVLGDVGDGAFNAAAQGVLYVKGSGGARCDTLTKHNPRFDPPQSWYLRDVGDSFAEFKAGGISVVCGYNPRNKNNVLGYRPCVGMVGGIIYFRGRIEGYSEKDVKLLQLDESDWTWLTSNMKNFLVAIGQEMLYEELVKNPAEWGKLIALTPRERRKKKFTVSISEFRKKVWEKEVGEGGIFAEYIDHERWEVIPYIVTGELRRSRPVWANESYLSPCSYACPTHIPANKILGKVRAGKIKEAADILLMYTPFPRTVCGSLCPNLCMDACTRCQIDGPVKILKIGDLSFLGETPRVGLSSDKRIAIIGGGPAGMSVAWQLTLRGYPVTLYEKETELGGKIETLIPRDKFFYEEFRKELMRFRETVKNIHLGERISPEKFKKIYEENDVIVLACGAHRPKMLNFPGSQHAISAYDFLREVNQGNKPDFRGRHVVIIGAGNVGMDVASYAYALGADAIYAIDIQKPSAFDKELEKARKKGVQIIWPKKVKMYEIQDKRIYFEDGTFLKADHIIIAIGEMPALDFVPEKIVSRNGLIEVNDFYQTVDPKIYAIGDVTGQGLITHAIGHGRVVAKYIDEMLRGLPPEIETYSVIEYARIKKEYYYGSGRGKEDLLSEAERCLSCATCRDCRVCELVCYHGAIARVEGKEGEFEFRAEDNKCIACGFCAHACPCGIWEMVPYT